MHNVISCWSWRICAGGCQDREHLLIPKYETLSLAILTLMAFTLLKTAKLPFNSLLSSLLLLTRTRWEIGSRSLPGPSPESFGSSTWRHVLMVSRIRISYRCCSAGSERSEGLIIIFLLAIVGLKSFDLVAHGVYSGLK